MKKIIPFLLLLLTGCSSHKTADPTHVVSMQLIDRNGFSETISAKERLATYEHTDFMGAQPYQKVSRVFGKTADGKTLSRITTYHSNGQLWQYLELCNGRAHGAFREWHPNGQKRIEAFVIEGTPDINEKAQLSWIFEGLSTVWDEEGHKIAEIPYVKGALQGTAYYYHPGGRIAKEIPYHKDVIDGTAFAYDTQGHILDKMVYVEGVREGLSVGFWNDKTPRYQEVYEKGDLLSASYWTKEGKLFAEIKEGNGRQGIFDDNLVLLSLIEYKQGKIEGEVQNFSPTGELLSSYHLSDGKKNGEELIYYPSKQPKLSVQWRDDTLYGLAKTWYENGVLESQREINQNKKHGLSFAWYKEGELMLMEEYEDDKLMKGSYFKKGDKKPISQVEKGKGEATLYDSEGHFLKRITYEKGLPQGEGGS